MLQEPMMEKLLAMRLHGMADALKAQQQDPAARELSFLDRLAMLKYGAPDLRAFFDADLRWLKHYGFAALDVPTLAGGLSR